MTVFLFFLDDDVETVVILRVDFMDCLLALHRNSVGAVNTLHLCVTQVM